LEGRRAVTGLDAGTLPAAVSFAPYTIAALGPDLVTGGDFAQAAKGISVWSKTGTTEAGWAEGKLDGGCLQHRYKIPSGTPQTSLLMIPAGALSAGKRYLLRFSILGAADHGSARVRLREIDAPWGYLTDGQSVKVDRTRRECSVLFTAPSDRRGSLVEWSFNERDGTFWLDNITLQEATVTEPDPSIFRLETNPTDQPRTVRLDQAWVDVAGKSYEGNVTLPPRGSLVLLRKEACTGSK
jgi:hypothetical protein